MGVGMVEEGVTHDAGALEMIDKARDPRLGKIFTLMMGTDMVDMRRRGCRCRNRELFLSMESDDVVPNKDLKEALPYVVNLHRLTPSWTLAEEVHRWCAVNLKGAYNDFVDILFEDGDTDGSTGKRVWQWAFADEREAFWFKTRWQ
jgi:hypothetical protein